MQDKSIFQFRPYENFMEDLIKTAKIFLIYIMIFISFVFIFKKKVQGIILDRQIYLLELQKKELLRKNQILKYEIAKRKNYSKESVLYNWKNFHRLPDYENQKIFKIIIDK